MDDVSQLLQTGSMSIDSASTESTDRASTERTDRASTERRGSASTERTGSTSTERADSASTVRALGFVTMATSVKTDRDTAAAALRQALRRLRSLTTESQLQSAMVTAKQQYKEVLRLHGLYRLEKGEDHIEWDHMEREDHMEWENHMEWEDSVGDAYNEAYTATEDKLEVLSQAKQPVEMTAKAKLERVGSMRAATLSHVCKQEGVMTVMDGVRSCFLWAVISLVAGGLVTNYLGWDGKILMANGITAVNDWLNPKSAGQKFNNAVGIKEQETVEIDSKGLQDFTYKHECKVYEKLDPSKYEVVIDSVGARLGLDKETITSMKLAQFTSSVVEAVTGYHHGRTGFYVWGQFRLDKRDNGELDLLIAIHKSSWKLESDPEAELEERRIVGEYKAQIKMEEGADGLLPVASKEAKDQFVKKFSEFSSKNKASITLKEKDQWLKYFQNDAHQALKDNCPDKRILNVLKDEKEEEK